MNNGHSDASTSTEDMKGRPLCLYYFTHPFGVLSPEPPRVATFETAGDGIISVAGARYTFDISGLNLPTFPMWPGAGARLPPLRVTRPPPNVFRTVGKRSLPPLPSAPTPPTVAPPKLRLPRPRTLALRKIGRRLRYVKGGRGSAEGESRALRAALRRLRDAWPPPRLSNCDSDPESEGRCSSAMWRRGGPESPALTPRPGASPGLLRRRYSVPETVMRKYRLAQLNSEEVSRSSVETCCCAPEPAPRLRRDRELMRRSALLRRLHGRSCRACCCGGCDCTRATRSLDASHSELRSSSRRSPASGRTSPKRLRLDSPTPRESRVILTPPSSELALSVSSRAHTLGVSYTDTDVFVASSTSESDYRDATDMSSSTFQCSGVTDVRTSTPAIEIENITSYSEDKSFADSSDTYSTSMCTAKETVTTTDRNFIEKIIPKKETENIHSKIANRSKSGEVDVNKVMPYDRPLTVETPSYDVLEIVVSETLNTVHAPIASIDLPEKNKMVKSTHEKIKRITDPRSANIDEYVSNILVESLNSLTDQLESMNASMGANGKLSIIEKEIKVKLQNTGVNTIVHLSPTSNNQIIFGHEELCCSDERPDSYNNARNKSISPLIRDVTQSPETINNQTSAESLPPSVSPDHRQPESFSNIIQPDNVNKAVLQQIQKLFQDDIQKMEPDARYLKDSMPSISHIEISNVDVYIENNVGSYSTTTDGTEKEARECADSSEMISSVGTGNYYENERDNAIVPRFSAFPHTDSMEVNTSSSDDAEIINSECTSLVDSLDDPNSPRSIMIRKSAKRSELVRSSIDVLDLLPESVHQTECASLKDKGEAFFVRIKDDECECDCEKKDIVVADHMPETIKQRLLRRHRKRELRMESARRSKVKQLKKELEKQRQSEMRKSKRELERECIALINALVDDVITKIAQDEYKCMRIRQKSVMMVSAKSDETLSRKNWKKDVELNNNKQISKNSTARSCSDGINKSHRKAEKYQIRGKLSLQTYPPLTSDENNTKRIYQKSEIHDGKKCIEILEILEYVNGSESSPETDNQRSDSDDNLSAKHKKSRIPIPVFEKSSSQNSLRSGSSRTQLFHNRNEKRSVCSPSSSQITNSEQSLLQTDSPLFNISPTQTPRRASIPHCEPRARSNSLRFKGVFDMIPEERSSLSIDSPNNDQTQSRRASVPALSDGLLTTNSEIDYKISRAAADYVEQIQHLKPNHSIDKKTKEMRSAGTSPMPNSDAYHSVLTQTSGITSSPLQRSAATSPIRNMTMSTQTPMPRRKSISNQQHPSPQLQSGQKQQQQKNKTPPRPQHDLPRPPQQQPRITRHRVAPEPAPRQRLEGGGNRSFFRRRSVSSQREAERLPRCGKHTEMAESGVAGGASASSSSSESGGSLLCPLAPAWLQARRRRRRANAAGSGQWAVTVAGSCPAALPADVEMRLRFPEAQQSRAGSTRSGHAQTQQRGLTLSPPSTRRAVRCSAQTPEEPRRLTLTMKKEASDSSILASKSVKKSMDPLPDVETFRASRSKTKSSVKEVEYSRNISFTSRRRLFQTRRGYSLHCWLPDGGHTPIRASNGLSVLGSAIVPEQKPRRPLPAYLRY